MKARANRSDTRGSIRSLIRAVRGLQIEIQLLREDLRASGVQDRLTAEYYRQRSAAVEDRFGKMEG